jgi:hypothetical protein
MKSRLKKRTTGKDVYQGEISNMLHRERLWTRPATAGLFTNIEPGAADLMCHGNGKGVAVEVKTGFNGIFAFHEWRENQREWALEYSHDTGCDYWLAIVIECAKLDVKLRKPRAAFLLPSSTVLLTERIFADMGRLSIPCLSATGEDALSMWQDHRLLWFKGWNIPEAHLFRMYCREE